MEGADNQLLEAVVNILIPVISPCLLCLGWTPVDIGPSTLEKISSIIPSYEVRNGITGKHCFSWFLGSVQSS